MENKNWLSPFSNDFWGDRFFPKIFNDFYRGGNFGPSVDLKETDKEIILHADIPGVNQEDLDITVDENVVILKGETKRDETREEKGYHFTERRFGSFYRTIPLPVEVKSEQAVARYKNGVLELRVPKVEHTVKRGFKPRFESGDYPGDDRTVQ
jgi:HSP20 family protein